MKRLNKDTLRKETFVTGTYFIEAKLLNQRQQFRHHGEGEVIAVCQGEVCMGGHGEVCVFCKVTNWCIGAHHGMNYKTKLHFRLRDAFYMAALC